MALRIKNCHGFPLPLRSNVFEETFIISSSQDSIMIIVNYQIGKAFQFWWCFFFKSGPFLASFFFIFIFLTVNSEHVWYENFLMIWSADLLYLKWPLCQLSHNNHTINVSLFFDHFCCLNLISDFGSINSWRSGRFEYQRSVVQIQSLAKFYNERCYLNS